LARGARVETTLGTYSVHHVQPSFFDGFEVLDSGIKLAVPRKRSRLSLSFTNARTDVASLPELELPRAFRRRAARKWIQRIPSSRLKTIVAQAPRRGPRKSGLTVSAPPPTPIPGFASAQHARVIGPAHSSMLGSAGSFRMQAMPLTDAIAQAQTSPAQLSRWLEVAAKTPMSFEHMELARIGGLKDHRVQP